MEQHDTDAETHKIWMDIYTKRLILEDVSHQNLAIQNTVEQISFLLLLGGFTL